MSKPNKPFDVCLELTEGCNLRCEFCAMNIIRPPGDNRFLFMSLDLAGEIVNSLVEWEYFNKRIECAMHGEPLMNPDVCGIVSLFKEGLAGCQFQITSNGLKLLQEPDLLPDLFYRGLNILIVDLYHRREELAELCRDVGSSCNVQVVDFYKDSTPTFHPHFYRGGEEQIIWLMDDLGEHNAKSSMRVISNLAGNADPQLLKKFGVLPFKGPYKKRCTWPFRELVIHFDGTVPLCCNDWRHQNIMGKFPDDGSLKEIWECERFQIIRALLVRRNREMLPCYRCDFFGGNRSGLLKAQEPYVSMGTEDLKNRLVELHLSQYRYDGDNPDEPIIIDAEECGFGFGL